MPAPTDTDVLAYLASTSEWTGSDDTVSSAFAAEKAAQARVCRVPADTEDWPDDLVEALCRRVSHNLAVRGNPLGVQTAISEFGATTMRVGGMDAEVRRLEAPWRRLVLG